MVERIHRSRSTISRELKHGTVDQIHGAGKHFQQYFAETGAAVYEKHRHTCFEQCPEFYTELIMALRVRPRVHHSVDGFIQTYKLALPGHPCPLTPTVYRDIDKGRLAVRNGDLPMEPRRRIKAHENKHVRTNQRVYGKSIEVRPEEVDTRQIVGHWEGALVKGTRVEDEPALMTLTERATRFEIILRLPDYHADTCRQGLQSILDDSGVANFATVAFDKGSEFAKHH
jgi:IS30 family transposase